MPNEENVLNETLEVPDVEDDAFLSGLLEDEDAYTLETDDAETNTGDAETDEEASHDGEEAESEADAESEGETAEAQPEDTNPEDAEEMFELTYNGQKVSMPRSEVITNAQKGLNYDHIKGQLDGIKNSKTQRQLMQLAEEAGMPLDQYVDEVFSNRRTRRVQELADTEGMSLSAAQRLVDAEEGLASYRAREQARGKEETKNAMYRKFFEKYPDVKVDDIPPEVWDAMHSGEDITTAFTMYENNRLRNENDATRAEIEQLKRNESNKQKAVGSVRGSKAAVAEDAFLSGLHGG